MGRYCKRLSLDFDLPAYDEDPALYVRCCRVLSLLQWQMYQYNPNCHDRDKFLRNLDRLHSDALSLLQYDGSEDDVPF